MLIYTSGSTGQPKGVMTSFRARSPPPPRSSSPTRASAWAARARAHAVPSAAGAQLRALVGRGVVARRRQPAPVLRRVARHLPAGPAAARGRRCSSRCRGCGSSSARRVREDAASQARPDAEDPDPRPHRREEGAQGLGLDAVVQAGSGSAPLPPEVIQWYRRLGLQLFEGYGMTEDNSLSHTSNERMSEAGWVGAPMAGVQVRLSPEGEILIKVAGPIQRLLKQPELTAESFTEDGFFRPATAANAAPTGCSRSPAGPRSCSRRPGQVRRAGADREHDQRAPDGRAVDGRRGPAGGLRRRRARRGHPPAPGRPERCAPTSSANSASCCRT